MIVLKFGGSSIATVEKIKKCISLIAKNQSRNPVVVLSACGKTTDMLLESAYNAERRGIVDTTALEMLHISLVDELELDRRVIEPLLYQLSTLLHGVSLVRELTPRTQDHILSYGERLSTRIIASSLNMEGVPAAAYNAYELGLLTNSQYGSAVPLPESEDLLRKNIRALKLVPIITGFLGKDKSGNITTLGRSGSDYSASIIGAAIDAAEIQIWTDVDGVMTCDPTIDTRARNLPSLSFQEASELAYYGAEVLHPSTLVPAIKKRIPVKVLNTLRENEPGSSILAEPVLTNQIAKSIVYKENVCLISLESPRLMSAVSLLSSAFEVLKECGIGVHMATTSEATVSMVTDTWYNQEILNHAQKKLQKLGEVSFESGKTIICVIGEELKGQVGILGKIFTAVSAQGIKAKMVSQSASEINIAFLVRNEQCVDAVVALHSLLLESMG